MAVDVGGHFYVGVPHPFLHIFESTAAVQQQTGATVPEFVKADMGQAMFFQ